MKVSLYYSSFIVWLIVLSGCYLNSYYWVWNQVIDVWNRVMVVWKAFHGWASDKGEFGFIERGGSITGTPVISIVLASGLLVVCSRPSRYRR